MPVRELIRGNFGQEELCGNRSMGINPRNLEEGKLTIFFRTSEIKRYPGFRMLIVCFKKNEKNLDGTYVHLY